MYRNIGVEDILQSEMRLLLPSHLPSEVRDRRIRDIRSGALASQIGAMYYYGLYLLHVNRNGSDQDQKSGWQWLYKAASSGSMQAKHFLDQVCKERYEQAFPVSEYTEKTGPLKDFDGREIRIRRTGFRTPVDAVLSFEGGENILTLKADLCFIDENVFPEEKDIEIFENAVMDGIREWEGSYEVFGGQKVRLRIELSSGQNIYDCVIINPLSREQEAEALKLAEKAPWGNPDVITNSAALTAFGIRKWSATSRKIIYFRYPEKIIKRPEYIKHIAKHEFGHVIGLGDLYQSDIFGLQGAQSSKIPELESYEILPKTFNLVMSNAVGPISNNDIEMVILAFAENRMQSYQPDKINRYISRALGRGN